MANYSDTIIKYKGGEDRITDAYNFIVSNMKKRIIYPAEIDDKYSLYSGNSIEIVGINTYLTMLVIDGVGRWCSPSEFFLDISKKYLLDMEFCDSEPGSNFFYLLEIVNGETRREISTNYGSIEHMKYDNCYERWVSEYSHVSIGSNVFQRISEVFNVSIDTILNDMGRS